MRLPFIPDPPVDQPVYDWATWIAQEQFREIDQWLWAELCEALADPEDGSVG